MLAQLRVPDVHGQTLKELVAWPTVLIASRDVLQFRENSRRETLVDDAIGQVAEVLRALHGGSRVLQSPKPEELLTGGTG